MQQEKSGLDINAIEQSVSELYAQLQILEEQNTELKAAIHDIQAAINQQRNELQQQLDAQNKVRSAVQQLKGREASLHALQQAALGKDDNVRQACWLNITLAITRVWQNN